ncbi:MAG: hypothetical protein AAF411_19690 [Myxococcota bacterium]
MTGYRAPEIEFANGERVRLVELRQTETYEGLLEGLPTEEMNARRISALRNKHPNLYVLPAKQTPIEWHHERAYPFGTPASLPPVQCVGRMYALEEGIYFRTATFAWFQSAWALPIEPPVLMAFREIEWSEVTVREEL